MPDIFTRLLSASRKHTIGFIENSFGKCCGNAGLTATPESCWFHPQESGPDVGHGPGGVGPAAELSVTSENREVFRVLLGLLTPCPEERHV